ATRVRGGGLRLALGDFRLRSNRPPSRLLHPGDRRRQSRGTGRASVAEGGVGELWVVAGVAGVGGRSGKDAVPHDRGGGRGGRRAAYRGRHSHRGTGPATGDV